MSLIPFGFWAASGGGAAGAFDLLETTTLTSTASSVTFSGLGAYSDYKHLQVRMVGRTDRANQMDSGTFIRLNGVSSSSYAYHHLYGDGSGPYSSSASSQTSMVMPTMAAANSGTSVYGLAIIDILDYAATTKNTTIRILNGTSTTSQRTIALTSGLFNSTAAITSVSAHPQSGNNWVSGSRFSLYGVK